MSKKHQYFKFELLKITKKDKKNVNFDQIKEMKFEFDKKFNVLSVQNYYNDNQPVKQQALMQEQEHIISADGNNVKNIPLDSMVQSENIMDEVKIEEPRVEETKAEEVKVKQAKVEETKTVVGVNEAVVVAESESLNGMNSVNFDLDPMVDPSFDSNIIVKEQNEEPKVEEIKAKEDAPVERQINEDVIEEQEQPKSYRTDEEAIVEGVVSDNSKELVEIEGDVEAKDMHKVIFNLDPMVDPSVDSVIEEKTQGGAETTSISYDDIAPTQDITNDWEVESVMVEPEEDKAQEANKLEEAPKAKQANNLEDKVSEETEESKDSLMTEEAKDGSKPAKVVPVVRNKGKASKQEDENLDDVEVEDLDELLRENEATIEGSKIDDIDSMLEEDLLIIDEFFKKEVNRQENDLVEKVVSNTFN